MADVSVRAAGAADVPEIARVQVDTWRTAYSDVLPAAVLDGLSVTDAVKAWTAAVEAPPTSQHHVLAAFEQQWLVGFAALAPLDEPEDGIADPSTTRLVGPLLVEPRWGRRGHGSRLLAAVVDYARDDGARALLTWLPSADSASLSFFRSAGWAVDGYARTLDTGDGELREVRLHTALAMENDDR